MTDKDTARQQIAARVEKFTADLKHYTSPHYNEIEVCIRFVDSFYKALGWDMVDNCVTMNY
jgi:hypothetical protein